MILIQNKYITSVGSLGNKYTQDDGLGLFKANQFYKVSNCVIDMTGVECDEAVAITWGASAEFNNCIIERAKKLILCGSGDSDKIKIESNKVVKFNHCLFRNFGRRGPEVQSGMTVYLNDCVIMNWAKDECFDTRSFAGWAHHNGKIIANNCAFIQDNFSRSIFSFIKDSFNHIGQHINDAGISALVKSKTYIPGICRGLIATDGGKVETHNCVKNKWWIYVEDEADVNEDRCNELLESFKI